MRACFLCAYELVFHCLCENVCVLFLPDLNSVSVFLCVCACTYKILCVCMCVFVSVYLFVCLFLCLFFFLCVCVCERERESFVFMRACLRAWMHACGRVSNVLVSSYFSPS